jgi:hypothetical protein
MLCVSTIRLQVLHLEAEDPSELSSGEFFRKFRVLHPESFFKVLTAVFVTS